MWPTSEHYFQAQKFDDREYQEKIRATPSAMIAARLGRSRKVPIRSDWEQTKDEVMYRAVLAKCCCRNRHRFYLDPILVILASIRMAAGLGTNPVSK